MTPASASQQSANDATKRACGSTANGIIAREGGKAGPRHCFHFEVDSVKRTPRRQRAIRRRDARLVIKQTASSHQCVSCITFYSPLGPIFRPSLTAMSGIARFVLLTWKSKREKRFVHMAAGTSTKHSTPKGGLSGHKLHVMARTSCVCGSPRRSCCRRFFALRGCVSQE